MPQEAITGIQLNGAELEVKYGSVTPVQPEVTTRFTPTNGNDPAGHPIMGLTKREYFAGQIAQGFVANPKFEWNDFNNLMHNATSMADILINKLNANR